MKINIRLEKPSDHYAVEELTREAFWEFWEPNRKICDEHLLVHRLWSVAALVPELNLVAEADGRLVGHIIYTKSKVVDDSGREYETLTFGPLSVLPEYQGMGIGRELMSYSFDEARKLGHRAVLIFGHPDYYPRVGFRRAAEFGITTADGQNFDPFMAYPLYDGALDGVHGRYFIDSVYEQLTEEAVFEFDKRFPHKDLFVTTPISILLDRLTPEARRAIEESGCQSLQMMTCKSEREISELPGIDAKAMEAIHDVLRGHEVKWGARKNKEDSVGMSASPHKNF